MPFLRAFLRGAVQKFAGFIGAAERAFAECGVNVFGSGTDHRDLGIVDQHGTVSRDRGDKTSFHQIDDQRRQTGLNYVATNSPDDRFLQLARATHARGKFS